MIALILAGGIGERLRPITNNIPKPMVPVNGKPFLQYHIEELKRAGIKDIVLCTGYLSNKIQEYFGDGSKFDVKIKYSIEKKPLGTAGAIKNAEKYVNNTFLVLNGDSYLKIDYNKLINFHKSKKAKLTIALLTIKDPRRYGLVNIDKESKILSFDEKTINPKGKLINGGVYIVEPEVLKAVPSSVKVSFEKEIFPKLIKQGNVYGFVINNYFIDIGTKESYIKAQEDFKELFREKNDNKN